MENSIHITQNVIIVPTKDHYEWLDYAKGIGIILVIMGHCIFPMHILIDIFHIPLFFLLAGVTFSPKSNTNFIIGKINRIGIPYCFWTIISSIANLIPHPYNGIFNGPLWFLQTLFVSLILMQISIKLNNILSKVFFAVLFLLSIISTKYNLDYLPFYLPRCATGFIYIYIGYKLSYYIKLSHRLIQEIFISISFLCLFILLFIYLKKQYNISGLFVTLSIYDHNYILAFICSLLGIFVTISFSKIFRYNTIINWMGKNSLVIMCVHFPFAESLNVYISSLPYYDNLIFRAVAAICEYIIIIFISCLFILLCKKIIPSLTGYKPLLRFDK